MAAIHAGDETAGIERANARRSAEAGTAIACRRNTATACCIHSNYLPAERCRSRCGADSADAALAVATGAVDRIPADAQYLDVDVSAEIDRAAAAAIGKIDPAAQPAAAGAIDRRPAGASGDRTRRAGNSHHRPAVRHDLRGAAGAAAAIQPRRCRSAARAIGTDSCRPDDGQVRHTAQNLRGTPDGIGAGRTGQVGRSIDRCVSADADRCAGGRSDPRGTSGYGSGCQQRIGNRRNQNIARDRQRARNRDELGERAAAQRQVGGKCGRRQGAQRRRIGRTPGQRRRIIARLDADVRRRRVQRRHHERIARGRANDTAPGRQHDRVADHIERAGRVEAQIAVTGQEQRDRVVARHSDHIDSMQIGTASRCRPRG